MLCFNYIQETTHIDAKFPNPELGHYLVRNNEAGVEFKRHL